MSQNEKQETLAGLFTHGGKFAVFMAAFGIFFILGGGGVDFARAYMAENELEQAASDTATALVSDARRASIYRLQLAAEDRMAALISYFADPAANVSVSVIGQSIRLNASAGMPTTFLRMFHHSRLPVETTVTADPPRPSRNLAWWG